MCFKAHSFWKQKQNCDNLFWQNFIEIIHSTSNSAVIKATIALIK